MIENYRRLEQVEEYLVDAGPLNYRRCRKLFTVPKDIPYAIVPYNKPVNYEKCEKFIAKNGCSISIDYIKDAWTPCDLTFDDDDVESE